MNFIATQVVFFLVGMLCISACSPQETNPTKNPSSMEEVHQSVRQQFEAGDYELALRGADQLCQRYPADIRFQLLKGELAFASNHIADSIAAYDNAIELFPQIEPRLWQRGLALYYAGRFEDGVKQFETHQTVNSQDVENAVWHLLCGARVSGVDQGRKNLIPIQDDTRVPMSQVYEMFAGRMEPAAVMAAAELPTPEAPVGSANHNLQRYFAHLYIGLYWEMLDKPDQALTEMKAAEKVNPLGKSDFMGRVASVHILIREQVNNLSSPTQIQSGSSK